MTWISEYHADQCENMVKQHDMIKVCLAVLLQSFSMWDVDGDEGGMGPPTLYECQSYFKGIRDFALAENNSELLADADRWQEKD